MLPSGKAKAVNVEMKLVLGQKVTAVALVNMPWKVKAENASTAPGAWEEIVMPS